MALRESAVRSTAPETDVLLPSTRPGILSTFAAVQPLLAPFLAAWLTYVALGVLLQSRAYEFFPAGMLPSSEFLHHVANTLAPEALLAAPRTSPGGVLVVTIYVLIVCAAMASWCWAIRLARGLNVRSIGPLLVLTALLATPLLVFTELFSDDVYLYHFYGRMIDTYGANPLTTAPAGFPDDPHLYWVHWTDLPSAYGPVWLLLSAVVSGIAGDSITAAVVAYRFASLSVHLATTAALWVVLRETGSGNAAAGVLFFAWNPLILVESVANTHNDGFVALFAVLVVAAATRRAWSSAAFFGACAVMVKPFAVLLLPPLALRIVQTTSGADRVRQLATTMAVGALSLVALSVPLWAGTALLTNIATNPASHLYTNTLWELIATAGPAWFGIQAVAVQHPYLDFARAACFTVGAVWVLTLRWSRRGVAQTAFPLWLLFTLTTAWVWPWYFMPAIALAALAGGRGLAVAAALTLGGLLFWATWTPSEPPVQWLFTWRSAVLFGPALLTVTCAPVRVAVLAALGARRRRGAADDNMVEVRLQTAPG